MEDGKLVAVKVLSAESKQGDKEFLSEIASLSSISHENLVKLHGCCIDGPCRILVYEYMENGSLAQNFLGNSLIFFLWLFYHNYDNKNASSIYRFSRSLLSCNQRWIYHKKWVKLPFFFSKRFTHIFIYLLKLIPKKFKYLPFF